MPSFVVYAFFYVKDVYERRHVGSNIYGNREAVYVYSETEAVYV